MFKVRYELTNIMEGDRKGKVVRCMAEFTRYEQAAGFVLALNSKPVMMIGFERHVPTLVKAVKNREKVRY